MTNEFARTADTYKGSIIGEHGFTAILAADDGKPAGIIGSPRIDPTNSGLCIADSYAAAIDAILIALLEDFVKHGSIESPVAPTGRAGPPGRKRSRQTDECVAGTAHIEAIDFIAA